MSLSDSTLKNATDAYVDQTHPNRNTRGSTRLWVRGGSNAEYAFIHFARPIPLGATVLSASLTLNMQSPGAGTKNITLKTVTGSWKVGRLTYANRPAVSTTDIKTVAMTTGTAAQDVVFDVKSHLQAVANGGAWYGWRVEMDYTTARAFNSAEAASHKPTLEVTYALPPAKPTGLAPSAGNAVSVASPLLRFNDVKGLNTIQVQTNNTSDFSVVQFDSGALASTVSQLDLSTTAFGGITNGQTLYWHVRVKDDGGLWSSWSDPAAFTRAPLPTLAFVTPTGNVVDEPTPTVAWSLTGGTQASYEVFVKDTNNAVLYDSGRISSADTSLELPLGVIKSNSATYRLVVRVWDTVARDGADNPWFQVTKDVTYHYTSTVATVTGLSATSLSPQPGVQLTWTRSTAPDSFNIRRNDGVLVDNIMASDALVSGTTYTYTDYTARPNISQSWTVEAVVNGTTSASNPFTASITPSVIGIWITDPIDKTLVQLIDTDEGSWDMGEESGVFTPVGSNRAYKVTQSLRGFEGHISGMLAESVINTKTIAQQEADMWAIKQNPSRTFYLTLSNISMPVVLGNIVVRPSPTQEVIKTVDFDFWQVDNVPFNYSP